MFPITTASRAIRAGARRRGLRPARWEPRNAGRAAWDLRDDEVVAIVFDAEGRQLRITAGDLREEIR